MTDWLSPEEWQAVALSLRVSAVATAASLPLGILVALALARGRFPGRQVLNGIVHLPLILPPVVTGYLLLLTFGRKGLVGQVLDQWFGVVLAFRWTGAALAAAIMAFPLMVRAIRLAIEAVDPKLEEAGATLGAARLFVFATSADAALTARLRTVVRVAAWGVVVWVNLRALWAMSSIDFMGGGLPGGAGLLPGLNDSDVRDLVRELDL